MLMYSYILFFLFSLTNTNTDYLLKQGDVKVTVDDIVGFSLKIPEEKRKDFFKSGRRFEDSLYSILNMKQVIKYGDSLDILKKQELDAKAHQIYLNNFSDEDFSLANENKKLLLYDFLKKEEYYKQVQKHVFESVTDEMVLELAEEEFILNRSIYKVPEKRDISYISIIYTDANKSEKKKLAKELLNNLNSKKISFKSLLLKEEIQADVEIAKNLEFQYETKYKQYSDYIFSLEKNGKFKAISYNNRFIIANLNKITPAKQLSFEEVSDGIFARLKEEIAEKKFAVLVTSLTQDQISQNDNKLKEIIVELQN